MTHDEARELLEGCGQSHVLEFWSELEKPQQAGLLSQIEELDTEALPGMQALLEGAGTESQHADIEPPDVVPASAGKDPAVRVAGEAALAGGEVGVVVVAGGQGTRLGFDGPKGCFPLAPVSNATLFGIHAAKVAALEEKYGGEVPFYVMTSRTNDGLTRIFFEELDYFGLSQDRVRFFVQGMWPALDAQGRLVLDRPDHIFMSPDGHGGILNAMRGGGVFDDMSRRGVETVFYFQVDNPLVEVADPFFVGLHREHGAEVSAKVCTKRDPDEGLGVLVKRGGRHMIVEYTELTHEQKHDVLPDGRLRFLYGSVAIHVFSRSFLMKEADAELPIHVAHKKVPYCDSRGNIVDPDEPNAFKFEQFIFDVLPDAKRVVGLEFAREDEFSPVKNAEGENSPETARRDMSCKFSRWLDACGVEVPRTASGVPVHAVEIDPRVALCPEDLCAKLSPDLSVTGDLLLDPGDGE